METQTQTNEKVVDQVPGSGGAIAVVQEGGLESDTLKRIVWTPARIQLLKREICPADISDDEFAIFLEKCRRSQMDPIMGEADCVPRNVKVKRPDGVEITVTKYVFQMREQGMEARADRHPDFVEITGAAVWEGDKCEVDEAAGTVKHVYDAAKRPKTGNPIGAWAKCVRRGRTPYVTYLRFDERVVKLPSGSLGPMWIKMPETMIRKCARFDVLKRAYPNTYAGLEIDADYAVPNEREVNAPPAGSSGVEGLKDRVSRPAGARGATVDAPSSADLKVSFKSHKLYGRSLIGLTDAELLDVLGHGSEMLKKWNPKWGETKRGEAIAHMGEVRAALVAMKKTPPAPGPEESPATGPEDAPFEAAPAKASAEPPPAEPGSQG